MMEESEIRRLIKQEVRQALNIILSGTAANAKNTSEDIQEMFPGMPGITARPVMHPYGFCSLAPDGTISVTAKQGDHIGNRLVLGHRAADRPSYVGSGEAVIYNEFGQQIYLKNGKILIGKPSATENFVLGQQLKTMLDQLLDWAKNHEHISGPPGGLTTPNPGDQTIASNIKSNFVDNDAILSSEIFGEKS